MMTAGAPPRGDDDMPDHSATQPGAVYDGENNCAPMLTARHGNGLPGSYTDTLDQLHRVPVWPGPQPPTAKALRRRRIRETLPEIGIVTLILVILGGLLAAAVLMTATGTVYDHARHHGAVITKAAERPAPPPGAGVTQSAQPGPAVGSYLAPRTAPAAPSPSRTPVPASSADDGSDDPARQLADALGLRHTTVGQHDRPDAYDDRFDAYDDRFAVPGPDRRPTRTGTTD